MAKKKNYKDDYDLIVFELGIGDLNREEQSLKMIEEGAMVLNKINDCNDKVKVDHLETVNDLMGIKLSKGQYGKIVKTCIDIEKKGSDPKFKEKLEEDCKKSSIVASIQQSLLSQCDNETFDKMEMPTDATVEDVNTEHSDNFIEILKSSVNASKDAKEIHGNKLNILSRAWQHLWNYEFMGKDYRKLVDDLLYEDGGYPKEDSAPKTWTLFKNFQELVKMMTKVGMGAYVRAYARKFDLEIDITDDTIIREWDGTKVNRKEVERIERENTQRELERRKGANETVSNETNEDEFAGMDPVAVERILTERRNAELDEECRQETKKMMDELYKDLDMNPKVIYDPILGVIGEEEPPAPKKEEFHFNFRNEDGTPYTRPKENDYLVIDVDKDTDDEEDDIF